MRNMSTEIAAKEYISSAKQNRIISTIQMEKQHSKQRKKDE